MIRFSPSAWTSCQYRVRYAAFQENILRGEGWHRHRHRYWVIAVAGVSGGTRVQNKTFSLGRTSVAIYAPGVTYEEYVESGRLVPFRWVLLEENGTPSILRRLLGSEEFAILEDKRDQVGRTIEELVAFAEAQTPGHAFLLSACVNRLIGLVVNLHDQGHSRKSSKEQSGKNWIHPWKRAVRLELDRIVPETLTISTIAASLDVSASTFTHTYKKVCGETFRETVYEWRLERLQALLERPDLSIKEMTSMLGFSHQSYLCAFIKKATGCSPTQLRRMGTLGKSAKL